MTLQIYNSLAREKQVFVPCDPENVRLYVCGPTVYDFAHIGNARPAVVFDVLFRLLRARYGGTSVTYVRNITDVDDKIIARAAETGEAIATLTARTERAYCDDMAALKVLEPTHMPRATHYIAQMVAMIAELVDKGHAYDVGGHVLFSVVSMPDYGQLSRRSRDDMIAGARVEVAPYKKDPADFVLWKPAKTDQPGWESPWGRGRPGWHIECSAMAWALLGQRFDIHGGGLDLMFPHHENEIAQSVCCHQEPLANFWMHNGYVVVKGEKMSKSLGNFFTVRQLLREGARGEALRMVLLSAHYRQPLEVSRDKIAEMTAQLDRFYGAVQAVEGDEGGAPSAEPSAAFVAALNDDLNTPLALSLLHEDVSALNKATCAATQRQLVGQIRANAQLLGLLGDAPQVWFQGGGDDDGIAERIVARAQAKAERDFARADAIRDELAARGIILLDGPDGTTWRRQ